jgi:uncharacterized protein YecE (DUF72 family)
MDFGRLPRVDDVDFTLPPDDPANTATFARLDRAGKPRVLLGAPQWGDDGYVGTIYPPGTPARDYLACYARQYPAVELNTTYYGVRPASLAQWRDSVPEDFRFCPKLPGEITHERRLVGAEAETDRFLEQLEILGPTLGVPWALLPESLGPESAGDMVAFVRRWPLTVPLAVELRHAGWFRAGAGRDSVWAAFAETGTIPVITDVAGRRDVLHQRITGPTVMLRFVGNRLHPTDFKRLDGWAERLARWLDRGVRTAYVFLHQPEEHLNLDAAEHLGARLRERTGLDVQVPQRVITYEQGRLFA